MLGALARRVPRKQAAKPGPERKEARRRKNVGGLWEKIPAATYSPTRVTGSTIGAGGLNGRVRNGNGCAPSAMATEKPMNRAETRLFNERFAHLHGPLPIQSMNFCLSKRLSPDGSRARADPLFQGRTFVAVF